MLSAASPDTNSVGNLGYDVVERLDCHLLSLLRFSLAA
jgi:hypothetical protein